MCSRNAHHLVVFLFHISEFALLPTSNSSNPSGARRGYCVNRACGLTDQTDRVVVSNRVRTQNSICHNSVRSSPRNLCLSSSFVMAQQSKEPCKKEACDIQACLTKNNFDSKRCLKVIELLQSCCEKCSYKSTHCASVAGLLKNSSK